jgi:hypothetical protein
MKKKINTVVNKQEDEDGYNRYAGNWIMNENEHSKKEPVIRRNQLNKLYGTARLDFRSYIRSLHRIRIA